MKKMKLDIQLFGASSSVQSSKYDGRYLKLTLTETETSIENNTSTIYWKFESIGGNSSYYSIFNYGVYINGSQVYDGTSGDKTKNYTNHSFPVSKGSVDGYVTITHNPDGTASDLSFSLHGKVYKSGTETHTGSLVLSTIPRASEPTLNYSTREFGQSVVITTNRYSSSFTHTLTYAFSGTSGTIATNVGASYTWTIPNELMNYMPSSTSGSCVITCKTYNGSTLVGTTYVSLTLNVPSSVVPTINYLTSSLQEKGDVPSSWHVWVAGKSKVGMDFVSGSYYGATITSFISTLAGYSYNVPKTGNNEYHFVSNYIPNAGTYSLVSTAKDTRGRTKTDTWSNIQVLSYSNPTISTAQVQRCDANGNIDNNGEYMYISYGGSITSLNNNNTSSAVYKVGYRIHNTGSYTYVPLTTNANSYSASGMLFTNGIKAASSSGTKVQFSANNTYDIQFYVQDYFTNSSNVQSLDAGFDLMNFNANGKAMAIGKVSEASSNEELLEIGLPSKFYEPIRSDLVVDSIRTKNMFNKNSVISGYYISDTGAIVSNSSVCYSDYIAVEPNTRYTISGKTSWTVTALYDSNKTFISRPNDSGLTTTSNTYYIRTIAPISDINNIQIEEGSTATTYTSYQELNNTKAIITGALSSEYTISSTHTYETLPLNLWHSVGSNLSISNNKVVIGDNISYVKISFTVAYGQTTAVEWKYAQLMKNNTSILLERFGASSNNPFEIVLTPILIPVQKGDTIYLMIYGTSGDTINSNSRTNIMVEKVI